MLTRSRELVALLDKEFEKRMRANCATPDGKGDRVPTLWPREKDIPSDPQLLDIRHSYSLRRQRTKRDQ